MLPKSEQNPNDSRTRMADRKQSHTLTLTPAAIEHGRIILRPCGDNFFPSDSFGKPSREDGVGKQITLRVSGFDKPIETDIPTDRHGRPRWFFRDRRWLRRFVAAHSLSPNDRVVITRLGRYEYKIQPIETNVSNDRNHVAPTFAEFFAGIGLMRMGLEREGWCLAFANDIDLKKREIYDGHFADASLHYDTTDIHELSPERVPTVDLATASFPCTDLSLAGGRRGIRSGQSSAFWGFCDVIAGMGRRRPPLVLLENVTGFLTSNGGRDFHSALRAMNELGYHVDPIVVDARWFVPQSRARLFVIASRLDNPDASGFAQESRLRPATLAKFVFNARDIDWQIRELPMPPDHPQSTLVDIIEDLPRNAPEWWNSERAQYFYEQISPRHKEQADGMINRRRWSYATAFRRVRPFRNGPKRSIAELRFDGIAGCLRTPKGGSGRQIVFKAGFGKYAVRLLTPRECARLMGAGNFRITGSLNDALFGFGDAVCVPAVAWLASHALRPPPRCLA